MSVEIDSSRATQEVAEEMACRSCGAILRYMPGTLQLKCEHCGATQEIKQADADAVNKATEEINLENFLSRQSLQEQQTVVTTVQCEACGAQVTLKPHVTSDACPFCATDMVVANHSTNSLIKPKSLLPFKIEQREAFEKFRQWLGGLWFAPGDLKKYANSESKLAGMYIPYWTYDSATKSSYSGERGIDHTSHENYTANEDGKVVSKSRPVTEIHWTFVSGSVARDFNDVLVVASKSLPENYLRALEPWNLGDLTTYDEKYLSGYRSESYQIDVKQGWDTAKKIMNETIHADVCRDIGGDHQHIHSLDTVFDKTTFKHTLLPIWVSSYRYHDKVYRFIINGSTGEVQGERPWSWVKIAAAVVLVIAIAAILYLQLGHASGI
ncbi:hypothetical protein [Nitrosomonas sp.]|uniref:hypothetical protein n=1 Tax=Nitrosomonas sp. TaxID=42353 RepID=UPI0032ED4FDC